MFSAIHNYYETDISLIAFQCEHFCIEFQQTLFESHWVKRGHWVGCRKTNLQHKTETKILKYTYAKNPPPAPNPTSPRNNKRQGKFGAKELIIPNVNTTNKTATNTLWNNMNNSCTHTNILPSSSQTCLQQIPILGNQIEIPKKQPENN